MAEGCCVTGHGCGVKGEDEKEERLGGDLIMARKEEECLRFCFLDITVLAKVLSVSYPAYPTGVVTKLQGV